MNAASIASALGAKKDANGWTARCPGHDDKNPSLSIAEGSDGRVLLNCHVGCSFENVQDALKAKGIELDKPEGVKLAATTWAVRDKDGALKGTHHRLDHVGGKKVWWTGPLGEMGLPGKVVDLPLYGSERVPGFKPGAVVFVTEGEKAADAARSLGVPTLGTVTGASAVPSGASLQVLNGFKVFLWPDHDAVGRAHMAKVGFALKGLGIQSQVFVWPEAKQEGDDAADFVARGGTLERLRELAKTSKGLTRKSRWLWEGVKDAKAEVERLYTWDRGRRIPTGLTFLDRILGGGLRPGECTLIGAATGSGKTSFAQQVAVGASQFGTVLFVTPEMDLSTLTLREMAKTAQRAINDVAQWQPFVMRDASKARLMQAADDLSFKQPRVLVMDSGSITMNDVEIEVSLIEDLVLVVVDYAQHVAGEDTGEKARYLQVGEVATRSIEIAKRHNVPVLLASQVNIQTAGKGGKRTYTFRETAKLEHASAVVLILDVVRGDDMQIESTRLICTKNRHGQGINREIEYDAATFTLREFGHKGDEKGPQQATLPKDDEDDGQLF